VSGSIAAYKAVEVARLLVKAGVRVVPVMTRSAEQFVGRATLAGVCGEPVLREMFGPAAAGESHVTLGARASVIALVPATAELLAAAAQGRANDLLRALVLCASGPVVAAPAMHPRMWAHPATQRNVAALRADGRVALVGPVEGQVASGEVGIGRMASPDAITAAIVARLTTRDLAGLRVVVTAGPTVEDLDPARFLSNRSSGSMGFAIAERAAARGAHTTLVAGPVSLATPHGVERVDVRSARQMQAALGDALGASLDRADVLVMCAAVADFRPASVSATKLKRAAGGARSVDLLPNPDLLAEIGAMRRGSRPVLVGFALETASGDELVGEARRKLRAKRVDLVVANSADNAFESAHSQLTLVWPDHEQVLPPLPKRQSADRVLDTFAELCSQ